MAAAGRAWGRSASRRILRRFLPGHAVVYGVNPAAGRDQATGAGVVGALGLGVDPADLLGLYRDDGRRRPARATAVAILNANYIARRLAPHFPIVYTGPNGFVAHECIIDLRGIKERTGIAVEDVAKRLVDFGFHAPTMSFPVPDTLMIEPTEIESPSASSTASARR